MKKIIFIDLDGTLKNSQKQVTDATCDALIRAKAAGHEIVFTSARPYAHIHEINKRCKNVCRYIIASTGSMIYDREQLLSFNKIPKSAVEKIYKPHPELTWWFHCTDGFFSTSMETGEQKGISKLITGPVKTFLKKSTVCDITVTSENFDLIKSMQNDIAKIPGIYISNQSKALADPSFKRESIAYCDTVAEGISKGSGVDALSNALDFPRENRIAIGDDINDIPMFAECGCTVAMGNAIPKVKQIANHITLDNNNDGVAKFLLALIKDNNI